MKNILLMLPTRSSLWHHADAMFMFMGHSLRQGCVSPVSKTHCLFIQAQSYPIMLILKCSCNRITLSKAAALQVHAKLIIVLTRGGSTARLVAKYRPSIPVLTVAVPVLTIDNLEWKCSGEMPARQCLVMRGLIPLLAEGSGRASDNDTTDDILGSAIDFAKLQNYLSTGDAVVALHRIGNASVIKLIDVK
jgi:pyruvate kinase